MEGRIIKNQYGFLKYKLKSDDTKITADKKTIFGKGLLCSDRVSLLKAAAEKAAAEKAAAEKENKVVWSISERERKIIEGFVNAD